MSELTAERYLSNIGFDDSHLPEIFNDDDKSYYKVTELMEGYFEARNQANGADKSTEPALHKHIVSEAKRKLPMAVVVRRNAKLMDYENFVSWYNEAIGNSR